MATAADFRLSEYKKLRDEISALNQHVRQIELFAITGTAAIYAWLATHVDVALTDWGWRVSVLFPLLGGLISLANMLRVMQIATYIKDIEATFGDGGWEHKLAELRQGSVGHRPVGLVSAVFWILLLLVTVAVAAVMPSEVRLLDAEEAGPLC